MSSINLSYTLILQIYIDGENAYFQFIMCKVFQSCFSVCFKMESIWIAADVAKKSDRLVLSFANNGINSFAFEIILKHLK